ncbi:MAG TPA: ABC transporter substrate-binding protein [Bordetella sp.]
MSGSTKRVAFALFAGLCGLSAAHADPIKVGLALDISGPFAASGADARDGFDLAIEKLGGKLGGQPAEFIKTDYAGSPEQVTQLVNRYIQRDKISFFSGPIPSNAALAAGPALFKARIPFISSNPGPSQYAGAQCSPYFFGQYQNDSYDEAAGKLANSKGYKNVVIIAPDYPAGRDHMTGFKRTFTGALKGEIYTKVGQSDYAAEISQIRSDKPDAVYVFLPGGMGINFIKQYVSSGLTAIPLVGNGSTADEDVIPAVGDAMLGMYNTAHWAHDLPIPANTEFVAAFRKKYGGRYPSGYAAMAYDTIMAMDAAVHDAGGVGNPDALVKALANPTFKSVRGDFTYGKNHYPIQDYYLRVVAKDADGKLTNKLVDTIMTKSQDAYVGECKL